MTAESWQQVDAIFQTAVELAPHERLAYLNDACGEDRGLRGEVDSLLTADSSEWDLIAGYALESAAVLFGSEPLSLNAGDLFGHYEIIELLGKGGMGEVYLARDTVLNRRVAVKLLPLDHLADTRRLHRFTREAETVSALNHPGILTIYEFGTDHGRQFIATEFVDGETLRARIRRGDITVDEAVDIAVQAARALSAAHRAGIIHRDIKPENIMIRSDRLVKVLDFGLAKLGGISDTPVVRLEGESPDLSSGLLLGTVRYMSPEQLSGIAADARSDIFSLGTVLYEMITGRPAFDEKEVANLTGSILKKDLRRPSGPLAPIAMKMLAKNPRSRYQTADELLTDLSVLKESAPRQSKFRGAAITLIVAAAVVSGVGFVSYKAFSSHDPNSPASKAANDQGLWTVNGHLSAARWHAEPVVVDDVLYMVGGFNGCTPFADVEAYDPATKTWTKRASMITPRGGHGVASLDGKLYAVGGTVDCGFHTGVLEVYDPKTDSWSGRASLPFARHGHSVAAANGKLYAIGGDVDKGNGYLRLNTEYDPGTNRWTERAPIPTPRSGASLVVVDGLIYVMGGAGDKGTLDSVEVYDPRTDKWTTRRPMLSPRMDFGASEIGGTIYIFGGSRPRLEVEAYDPASDTWTVVGKMPKRRTWFHAATYHGSIYFGGGSDGVVMLADVEAFTPAHVGSMADSTCPRLREEAIAPAPTARNNMTIGEIGGMIYAAGGHNSKGAFLATNEAYDPRTNEWRTKAPLPAPRETRGTNNAVVDGKLFVIGGNASGECSSRNEAYDPTTDTWIARSPMPTPRCHLAVIAADGLIYAFGGTNTSGTVKYDALEIYDPGADSWTTGAPMPSPRQDVGAAVVDGIIYALGGGNPALSFEGELDIVEAYDPKTDRWVSKPPMTTPRVGFAVAELNGMIVVLGGSNEKALSTAEAFEPKSDRWVTLSRMTTARNFISAINVNDKLYIFGGFTDISDASPVSTNAALSFEPCKE